jgi:hypothetical protein
MFKMPTGVAALLVAGLSCLACGGQPGLGLGEGDANGGQAASSTGGIGTPGLGGSGAGGQSSSGIESGASGSQGGSIGSGIGGQPVDTNPVHECQLNADGTCSALTVNTACTPFTGRRYDESAGCYATVETSLWCCATAAGESCAWPPAIGCVQVAAEGGTVAYWTPGLPGSGPLPAGQTCDQGESARVSSSPSCLSTAPDAAAPDGAEVISPDGSADKLGSDSCVTPTEGAACSAAATVCLPNSCCGIYWVCTNGRWAYGIPCPCVPI